MKLYKVLTVLLVVILLAGCAQPAAPVADATQPSAASDSQSTEAQTPAENQEGSDKEPVTLRFQSWRLADAVPGPLYQKWIDEYQQENPHVTIEAEPVPYAQRLDVYTAKALAGDPPDIVGIDSGNVVQLAGLGQVENLDQFYTQEGEDFKNSFAPAAISLSEFEGSLYAVTHELATADGIWYNIQMLEAANIDPNSLTTWEAYVSALQTLTKDGKYGTGLRGKDVTGAASAFWPYISQMTGPMALEEEITEKLCTPEAQEVYTEYTKLFIEYGVTPLPVDIDYNAQLQLFAQGQSAFLHNGSWMNTNIKAANPEMEGNYAAIPLPLFEGGKQTVLVDGMSLMIGKGSDNPQEAWNFIKYITDKEHQLENFQTTGFLPSRVELMEDPLIQADPVANLYLGLMADYGIPRPRSVKANEVWTVFVEEWQNALLETKTPEEALNASCARINEILAK